jgi:hypothetical protein
MDVAIIARVAALADITVTTLYVTVIARVVYV